MAAEALESLAGRYWRFLRHEFPLNAVLAGAGDDDDPVLFRESPADCERRAATAAGLAAELAAIPLHGLALRDRITHRLLERELADLRASHATASHLRPWLLPVGPEFGTIYFANSTELVDTAAARAYVARLETVPAYLADVGACLSLGRQRGHRYPAVVLSVAMANLHALAEGAAGAIEQTPWFGPLRRAPAGLRAALGGEVARAREAIERGIVPALRALAELLRSELLPVARPGIACTDDPQGAEYYAHWVRHFTTDAAATPQALHALGLENVARLEDEIAALAGRAGFADDVPGYRQFLRDDPGFRAPSAEALRVQIEALAKRIDGLIPSVIGHLPRTSYGVKSIPAAMAGKLPIAYAQPNPADGSAAGQLWVSSLPERVPDYLHVSLVLHEAWPGHLMHIALMQEMDHVPMFRRANFTKYTACLEGWAMYCESLGLDLGLYETPHQHFGRLDMEMWRACRLVVDTGIHTRGWSREQAVDYMARRLSMSQPAIEAEVDRYIALPGQALAYLVGGLRFRELRRRAEARLGARFNLRRFHDRLMAAGAVTLPVLDEAVDDWITQHAA